MAAGGAERSRLKVVALVITVAFACGGLPAEEDGAAMASPSAAPPTPPPTETTRPAPIASATIPTTATFSIRLEPPAPPPGAGFVIVISGLHPGEQFELSVARPGEDPSLAPYKADARGEFRSIVPPGALTVFTVVARRADGASAQLAFGTAALGPLTPTPRGTAGSATPSALQPLRTSGALPAPATGAPAERPSPSLGPTPAPFAVTLERVTDAGEIEIVLSGLRPSELVELSIGLPASPDDVYRVNADAGGAFRWRSPVAPGLAFTVVARRATGEMARAAATAAPTPSVPATEPPCVTTGAGDTRTGIEGYFALGGRALVGLTVEMREWGGVLSLLGGSGCLTCPLHGTGVTDREGRVVVVGLPPGVLMEPVVPDPRYTRDGHLGSSSRGTTVCAGRIVPATTRDEPRLLYWKITGFETSIPAADGTMALRWHAVPEATTYCVRMLDQGPPPHTTRSVLTPGSCMALVDHTALAAATFRTPPLIAGERSYDLQIVAFTGANASGIFSGGFTKFE